jgi:V/A-type H+-transporting ATPase subunit K
MKKFLVPLFVLALASVGLAQEAATASTGISVGGGLVALAAGLALGLAAIGVGLAQGRIGSAAAGTLAERPEAFGQLLIYIILPETLIIFGFLVVIFFQGSIR